MTKAYELSAGVKEQLLASLSTALDAHVQKWKQETEEGIISEETCSVFDAMEWIPSKRDSRLKPVDE